VSSALHKSIEQAIETQIDAIITKYISTDKVTSMVQDKLPTALESKFGSANRG
jgi:hypothetical protein